MFQSLGAECLALFHPISGVRSTDQAVDNPQRRCECSRSSLREVRSALGVLPGERDFSKQRRFLTLHGLGRLPSHCKLVTDSLKNIPALRRKSTCMQSFMC